MQYPSETSPIFLRPGRPGYLAEVTLALMYIRDIHACGRLSIRNGEQFGIAHLYFRQAKLVHVTGDKRDSESVLQDLLSWSKGTIRFDAAITVEYEDITWQQAQIFARWLSFLEMRALLQGIPQERLNELMHSMTVPLPGRPLALPEQVEHYEKYNEAASTRQWQRLGEGVNQAVERAIPKEQRQQLQQVSQSALHLINNVARQTGLATQGLTRQVVKEVVKVFQERTQRTPATAKRALDEWFEKKMRRH